MGVFHHLKRDIGRWGRAGAIATLTVLVTGAIAFAQSSPFFWESIDVDLDIHRDGKMWVTETQTYVFEQDHTTDLLHE